MPTGYRYENTAFLEFLKLPKQRIHYSSRVHLQTARRKAHFGHSLLNHTRYKSESLRNTRKCFSRLSSTSTLRPTGSTPPNDEQRQEQKSRQARCADWIMETVIANPRFWIRVLMFASGMIANVTYDITILNYLEEPAWERYRREKEDRGSITPEEHEYYDWAEKRFQGSICSLHWGTLRFLMTRSGAAVLDMSLSHQIQRSIETVVSLCMASFCGVDGVEVQV